MLQVEVKFSTYDFMRWLLCWLYGSSISFMSLYFLLHTYLYLVYSVVCICNIALVASYSMLLQLPSPSTRERNGFWLGHPLLIVEVFTHIFVLPHVRIPKREERRLSRQCNSQKGKFITDSSQGFLPQPTQWCRVRKALSRGC